MLYTRLDLYSMWIIALLCLLSYHLINLILYTLENVYYRIYHSIIYSWLNKLPEVITSKIVHLTPDENSEILENMQNIWSKMTSHGTIFAIAIAMKLTRKKINFEF